MSEKTPKSRSTVKPESGGIINAWVTEALLNHDSEVIALEEDSNGAVNVVKLEPAGFVRRALANVTGRHAGYRSTFVEELWPPDTFPSS